MCSIGWLCIHIVHDLQDLKDYHNIMSTAMAAHIDSTGGIAFFFWDVRIPHEALSIVTRWRDK